MSVRARLLAGLAVAAAVVLPGAGPAVAHPSAYSIVEQTYSTTGTVPPCRFSSAELDAAIKQAPTYDVEYFGDFTDAINAALNQQAAGRCGSAHASSSLRETGLKGVKIQPLPASATSGTYGSIPLPLLLALILVVCGVVAGAAARLLGILNRPR